MANGTNTVPASDGNYTSGYTHIRNCNLLLEKAAGYADQESITQAVGEAYFFRAYSYFENASSLWRSYYHKLARLTRIAKKLYATRSNRTDVMDLIISDLHNAIDHLKDFKSLEAGRISREGALAYLSRVALYEGTWQKFHNDNTAKANSYLDEAAKAARESY